MLRQPSKYTVIIPTRERPDTLRYCLRTLTAQKYDNFEIIVSDNNSLDDTADVVHACRDSRVRYLNTGRRLSMSHNWEFALGHVTDGWVGFLGDDDGLLPGALARLDEALSRFPCDAVSAAYCTYAWPQSGWTSDATLGVPLGNSFRYVQSRPALSAAMEGRTPYQALPWLYHGGFAQITTINRARAADGSFFRSQVPDLYSAIALACVTQRYLRLGFPLAINGASRHSTGSSYLASKDKGGPREQFLAEPNIPFHSRLIAAPSLQILLYESYLQSEFIHHDALHLSLNRQLALAYAGASIALRRDVLASCQAIATQNGTEFSPTSVEALSAVLEFNARSLRARGQSIARSVLRGADRAGKNVAEAAERADAILRDARSRGLSLTACKNIGDWLYHRFR